MHSTNQELIDGYLAAVREATRSLPRGQQETILGDLESHIEHALPADPEQTEVRNVLDRLGSPESIATEAGASVGQEPSRTREVLGLIGITVGSLFVPIIGWTVGIVLVWMSPVWSKAQKLTATMVWPFGWFAMLLVLVATLRSSTSLDANGTGGTLQVLSVIVFVAAPLVVLASLIRSLVKGEHK